MAIQNEFLNSNPVESDAIHQALVQICSLAARLGRALVERPTLASPIAFQGMAGHLAIQLDGLKFRQCRSSQVYQYTVLKLLQRLSTSVYVLETSSVQEGVEAMPTNAYPLKQARHLSLHVTFRRASHIWTTYQLLGF